MTKEEFMTRMADAERQIRHSVTPLGIIYSVQLAGAFGLVYTAVLQWKFCRTDIQTATLLATGSCLLLFLGGFPWERYSKRRFVRLALKCPACQSCLVFLQRDAEGQKTLDTGLCYHCGERVFDV
jgi:hypothetical protein